MPIVPQAILSPLTLTVTFCVTDRRVCRHIRVDSVREL
jgi:hypothetical protein